MLVGPEQPIVKKKASSSCKTLVSIHPLGRDSSIGIATCCGLGCTGIKSRWGAIFSAPVKTGPGSHPASYTMGTRSLPGVKQPGCGVDHPTHLAPRLKKEYSYTSTPPRAFVACSRVNVTFTFIHSSGYTASHTPSFLLIPCNLTYTIEQILTSASHRN